MPAELELVDQVEETETTKEICSKMVKAESEHTENTIANGTLQPVPDIIEGPTDSAHSAVKENGIAESVPDVVDTPNENPITSSEAELFPEATSQPDIVLESESSQQSIQEPEVCQLPRQVPEPEVCQLPKQVSETEVCQLPRQVPEPESVIEEPQVPEVCQSPGHVTEPVPVVEETTIPEVHSNGHQSPEGEEPVLVCPRQPAPVVQSLEPKTAPEVRSETVKKLIQQTEQETDSKAPVIQNGTRKKVQMMTSLDEHAVRSAYDDVRADNTETQWAVFKFQGSCIVRSAVGSEFEKFKAQFTENERAFGFIRVQVGDEMSKRQKFVFITWVGPAVSVIQRAKMSTDKALMKHIISNFAVELQPETLSEINLEHFKMELNKAGGANYGTGVRDS